MDSHAAARLVREALAAAVAGDSVTAGEKIGALGRDSDPGRMYGVCHGVASAGKGAVVFLFNGRQPDRARGQCWYVVHLRPHLNRVRRGVPAEPWHLFSERFLIAHFNDDDDNARALYGAALSIPGEHFVRCVAQLFADVAGLCAMAGRRVREQDR